MNSFYLKNAKKILENMMSQNNSTIKGFKIQKSAIALNKGNSSSQLKEILVLGSVLLGGLLLINKDKKMYSWIYRDDIGAPHGIHGYEEQVNSVGQHHGHFHWTQEGFFNTFDSAAVRRGFKVWLKSCQSCHGAYKQKYDVMVDKVFSQQELILKMKDTPPVHPGHQLRRGFYFNEWDYRQRLIHDRIWSTYMTRDHAKSANGGLWPVDLSRTAEHNPAHAGYIYNMLTGYHYLPPFGADVPEGRYFNPYHHHMIIGMPRVRIFIIIFLLAIT